MPWRSAHAGEPGVVFVRRGQAAGFFLRQRPGADIHQIFKAGFGDGIEQGFARFVVMQWVDVVAAFP